MNLKITQITAEMGNSSFARFIITGIACTALNYLVFYVLYSFIGLHYGLAFVCGFVSGVLVGYPINRVWSFRSTYTSITRKIKYLTVYLVSMALGCAILFFLVAANADPGVANIAVIVLTTITNFIGLKYLVFKNLKPCIIGVVGDSGAGKTYLTVHLAKMLGKYGCVRVECDGYHKYDRKDPIWNEITHLSPDGSDIALMYAHADTIRQEGFFINKTYCHKLGIKKRRKLFWPKRFVIFEGLHTLLDVAGNNVWDLKVFVDADRNIKRERKIKRDVCERGHSIENVSRIIDRRMVDFDKHIMPQKKNADVSLFVREELAEIEISDFFEGFSIDEIASHIEGTKVEFHGSKMLIEVNRMVNEQEIDAIRRIVKQEYPSVKIEYMPADGGLVVLLYYIIAFLHAKKR